MYINEQGPLQLPTPDSEPDRYLVIGHTIHCDVGLATWQGTPALPTPLSGDMQSFHLRHGGEALLTAACLGYYARLGVSADDIRDQLQVPIQVLAPDAAPKARAFTYSHLFDIAAGEPDPYFDIEPLGWRCLLEPTSVEPGSLERTASTGVFTAQQPDLGLTMIIAHLPPHRETTDIPTDRIPHFELTASDIPPVITAISRLAMGEYREQVATLLHHIPA